VSNTISHGSNQHRINILGIREEKKPMFPLRSSIACSRQSGQPRSPSRISSDLDRSLPIPAGRIARASKRRIVAATRPTAQTYA
jgi:hypothetical protein